MIRSGDTVLVQHKTEFDRRGMPYEAYTGHSSKIQTIDAVYMDGRIRTSSGDVWSIKRCSNGKAVWETVRTGKLTVH